MIEPEVENGY